MRLPPAALPAACGLLSAAAQVALLRELAVAAYGVELVYLAGLLAWLLGGAAGTLLRPPGAPEPPGGATPSPALPLLLLALLLPAEAAFLRGSRLAFGAVPGAYLPPSLQAATALLGLAPAGLLFAVALRRAVARAEREGSATGAAYGAECGGAAAGAALSTLSLHAGAGNLATLLASSSLCAALAAALPGGPGVSASTAAGRGTGSPVRRSPARAAAALLPALLLAAALPLSGRIDRAAAALARPGTTVLVDTPYGRVSVSVEGGRTAVFEDDALVHASESTDGEEFAHLAALQLPEGARVLLLGGAAGGIVEHLLPHRPSSVTAVERDRRAFRAVSWLLPPESRKALVDPSVRVLFGDPRRFLSSGGDPFDLVLVSAPEPLSAASNRFYTAEFFRECARRLSPGGILAFRLGAAEAVRSPLLRRRDGSVRAALAPSFPSLLVVPGGTDTWIAGKGRLERDGGELARRFAERRVAASLVSAPWLRYSLSPERLADAEPLPGEPPSPPNRDGSPECFAWAALLWAGRFAPALAARGAEGAGGAAAAAAVAAGAAFLLLPPLLRRGRERREGGAPAPSAFAAGFSGMALTGVVALRFQAESGSLYGDLGILLFAFMAGMAAGAAAAARGGPAPSRPLLRPLPLLCALSVLLAAALASPGAAPLFRLAPASALLFAAAALCGGAFSRAARLAPPGAPSPFRPLYAADLVGAAAALVSSLVLLPFLGSPAVALLCAAACAGAAAAEGGAEGFLPGSPVRR